MRYIFKKSAAAIAIAFPLLCSCGKDDPDTAPNVKVDTEPNVEAEAADTEENDIFNAFHLNNSKKFYLNDYEIIALGKERVKLDGNVTVDQFYTIVPLYAYETEGSNYTGDFYLVDATISIASDAMYKGLNEVTIKRSKNQTAVYKYSGFYLTGYGFDAEIVTDDYVKFNEFPLPKTTENAITYTSGTTVNLDATLSGTEETGGITIGSGVKMSKSKTRSVNDIGIVNNTSYDGGKVSYKISVNNLPKKSENPKTPPTVARTTFDLHYSWIWQIPGVPERDKRTFKMKTKISDLSYVCMLQDHSLITQHDFVNSFETSFDLPAPCRKPVGSITIGNSEEGKLMRGFELTDSRTREVFKDESGSVYSAGQEYKIYVPEGDYRIRFILGDRTVSGSGLKVSRGKDLYRSAGSF